MFKFVYFSACTISYKLLTIICLLVADTWQDIKDENGQRLIIGQYHFTKKVNEGFVASNKARDVLAAIKLSTKLLLEESTVHNSHSRLNDSLMKIIKTTSLVLLSVVAFDVCLMCLFIDSTGDVVMAS